MAKRVRFNVLNRDTYFPNQNKYLDNYFMRFPNASFVCLDIRGDTSPATIAQVKADADAEFDGRTTAAQVKVVSSSADDAVGGSGCTLVDLIGIVVETKADRSTHYKYTKETVSMDGVTHVTSTNSFVRVIDAYPLNGTPAGNITVMDAGATPSTTYLTIAAGEFFSNGNKIFVMNNYYASIISFEGRLQSRTAALDAVNLQVTWSNFDNVVTDTNEMYLSMENQIQKNPSNFDHRKQASHADAYLECKDLKITNAEVYDAKIWILISENP